MICSGGVRLSLRTAGYHFNLAVLINATYGAKLFATAAITATARPRSANRSDQWKFAQGYHEYRASVYPILLHDSSAVSQLSNPQGLTAVSQKSI